MTDEEVYRSCADAAINTKEGIAFGVLNDGRKLACVSDWRVIEGWANGMPVTGRKLTSKEGRSVQFFELPEDFVFPIEWKRSWQVN
jgi:hypothetical protein